MISAPTAPVAPTMATFSGLVPARDIDIALCNAGARRLSVSRCAGRTKACAPRARHKRTRRSEVIFALLDPCESRLRWPCERSQQCKALWPRARSVSRHLQLGC